MIGAPVNGGAGLAGHAAPAPAASGTEVCDGVDNDDNGVIDDVDAEGDGVCDCLNIATLGEIGPWSDGGNVFKGWLDARSPRPARALGDEILSDELLRPYQVIVVLYVATFELNGHGKLVPAHHAFSADEAAAFARWIEAGGGVMTTIGYTSDEGKEVVNVNQLLAPFGQGYVSMDTSLDGVIMDWTPHPITEGVKRISLLNGVQPLSATGTSLAHDGAGRVALQIAEAGSGHIAVWGDEWITYDSEWRDMQNQQVARLWLNLLKWLSPTRVCQVQTPELL